MGERDTAVLQDCLVVTIGELSVQVLAGPARHSSNRRRSQFFVPFAASLHVHDCFFLFLLAFFPQVYLSIMLERIEHIPITQTRTRDIIHVRSGVLHPAIPQVQKFA